MEKMYFVFGAVMVLAAAFVAFFIVIAVMTFKTRKTFNEYRHDSQDQRQYMYNEIHEYRKDLEEFYKKSISHTDKRVDQVLSQLEK